MTDPGVRCMIMRGGTSKGAYFLRSDLPSDRSERDDLLLRIMGSPDARQIDGIGGAHPLTSKVAIVAQAARPDADIEYLFLQVGVDQAQVSDRQNCGNLLAGVAAFALERGLVSADQTRSTETVAIHMLNTDSIAQATVQVTHGTPNYSGTTAISGVPGTAAPIQLDFDDLAGGSTGGALLPTGNLVDTIDGVDCTLIDNGMPVVVLRADALNITGHESVEELEADATLRRALESIRLQAGVAMNLGDVSSATVPKLTMVAAPLYGGSVSTRTFIPHRCHEAIGVLGAVSVATAALLPGTPAHDVFVGADDGIVALEHPTGTFEASVALTGSTVQRAGIIRTARKIMDGLVFPRSE